MRLFIFGYGYSARAIASELKDDCEWIAGTSRDADKMAIMEAEGVKAFTFDGYQANPDITAALNEATHLLVSAGPDASGDPALNCHRLDIANASNLKWIGYLSTVGVYGDHDGEWIDEKAQCRPVSKRSVERVAAEGGWQNFAGQLGLPLSIFRLAGIYGPGRNGLVNLSKGRARRIHKKGQVFNRIHVADIAQAVAIAARKKKDGIYNISDMEPAPPQDVIEYAANLMGAEVPPLQDFETMELTPMARSFYGECKRCKNDKLLKLIGGQMRYPTYREAFTEMWVNDTWRG
jgi:nucleoside-diphosphate-sugar epimerase